MKKISFIAVLVYLMITSIAFAGVYQVPPNPAETNYDNFKVIFKQDTKIIEPNNHVVSLEKKEFSIVIYFNGFMGKDVGVRMKPSLTDEYYLDAKDNIPLDELSMPIIAVGLAEKNYNADKEIFVSSSPTNMHWLVYKADMHRFTSIEKKSNTLIATRNVNKLVFDKQTSIPVEEFQGDIYLTFHTVNGNTVKQQDYYK